MIAPDNWHWVFYDINHFNMSKFANACLNTSTKAEQNMPDYDWVHNNQCTEVMGWQDYHFLWMSELEDETFEHPGPASGRRGEWPAFNLSVAYFFLTVGIQSAAFDQYLLTGVLPTQEDRGEDQEMPDEDQDIVG